MILRNGFKEKSWTWDGLSTAACSPEQGRALVRVLQLAGRPYPSLTTLVFWYVLNQWNKLVFAYDKGPCIQKKTFFLFFILFLLVIRVFNNINKKQLYEIF
tara:strand:+ start:393 stop:695 length:303 start_codon:yes stop_codon:yes gene_type:complete